MAEESAASSREARGTGLDEGQRDRAIAVVLASALGDALGAGYEFSTVAPDLVPGMIGGGLGNFAPGEWTDDTAQAVAVARAAADHDLRTEAGLDAVAAGFARWFADGPADVGVQTRAVLSLAGPDASAARMRAAALTVHERTGRSAGNGALMRTGPVAVAYLADPEALVEAALAVARLTHVEADAGESSALWCLLVRHTVLTGEYPGFDDVAAWVPRRDVWRDRLAEAEAKPPSAFTNNAWTVGALQAAWSAIVHTPRAAADPSDPVVAALTTAIRIGHDTDTVAAIAGALLGARWGTAALPARWAAMVHGWPGLDWAGLRELAVRVVG
ncbi:MAG TPA: ribosylglycohydrolase [Micrococcales bacterium]|uniref:ADP-ribosylglycohydrolase family protein n=1 Tax=Miniimonas arenae TaxID=676201 RepID=UPI000ECF1402|nr:ADP-ribosylglycohydrolase family protein [Miniimonas arenae]HCX85406.1 ribosylglycohydrolase [Micrococcales bacterium]